VIDTEPEWDEDTRGHALALAELEADTCSGCGGRLSETLHQKDHPDPRWDVGADVCTRCRSMEKAQRAQSEKDHDPKSGELLKDRFPHALRWWARPAQTLKHP